MLPSSIAITSWDPTQGGWNQQRGKMKERFVLAPRADTVVLSEIDAGGGMVLGTFNSCAADVT